MTDEYVTISYWNVTKNIYYSLLFIFPMLFLYESMCWIQYLGKSSEIRNGADVLIRHIFVGMGNDSEKIVNDIQEEPQIQLLERQLQKAIDKEEYEMAARIRDKINEIDT